MKLTLVKVKEEADGIKSFYWKPESKVDYLPGQYYYFTIPSLKYPSDRGNTRHFTLSSSPTEELLCFTTKIRDESGYKKTLNELEIGTNIEGMGPNGTFAFDETKEKSHIFVAGGIGITPFRSIIRYIYEKNLSINIHLLYSASTPDQLLFKDEFDHISSMRPHIIVTYTITQNAESVSWSGKEGRIDADFIHDATSREERATALFWVCGPPPMVTALEETLSNLHISQERIWSEKFTGY